MALLTVDHDTTLLSRHPPVIPAERLPLPPGLVLAERLQVLHHLGNDALGATVVALDAVERRRLAVKVLVPLETGRSSDPHGIYRLSKVLDRVRKFDHPVNARLIGHFGEEIVRAPSMVIVMERVASSTLEDILGARKALDPHQAVSLVDRVAQMMEHAHDAGLFHLGLSPSVVHVLPEDLDSVVPKVTITDLGLIDAIRQAAPRLAIPLDPRSTAPEVFQPGPIDARADVYSLGALLWAALGGRQPQIPDIDPALLHLVERATSMRPQDRYDSVSIFRDILQRAIEGRADDPTTEVGIGALPPPLPVSPSLPHAPAAESESGAPPSLAQVAATTAARGLVSSRTPATPETVVAPGLAARAAAATDPTLDDDADLIDERSPNRVLWYLLAGAPFVLVAAALLWVGVSGSFSRPVVGGAASHASNGGSAEEISAGGPADGVEELAPIEVDPAAGDATIDLPPEGAVRLVGEGDASDGASLSGASEPAITEPIPPAPTGTAEPVRGTGGPSGSSGSSASSSSPAPTVRPAETTRPAAAPAPEARPAGTRPASRTRPLAAPVEVRLVTQPEGAVVFEGETILGNTPLTVSVSPDAAKDLVFWLPGHATHPVRVDGSRDRLEVALKPESEAP